MRDVDAIGCRDLEIRYTDLNARTVDHWVEQGWEWGTPIDHVTFERARRGSWDILLTPNKTMPRTWLPPEMRERQVLGLAAGGGQQMPIMAALGARCALLDYSPQMLAADRLVAEREGYDIEIVRADMTRPLPFDDDAFDLIIHPVANCYVEEVLPIWRECHRVLAHGGRLIAGLDNGFGYAFDDEEERAINRLPYNPLRDPALLAATDVAEDGIQFSHTLEDQIAGQLRAGFTLLDCYEDTYSEGRLHDLNIPTFWATLCEKRS